MHRLGSMRRSSSVWRGTEEAVFSRSSREGCAEDDEEALRWAALEKLPTFDRVRRGFLSLPEEGGASGLREVDVGKLGFGERRALVERLLRVAEEDNELFLLKLNDRIQRSGISFSLSFLVLLVVCFLTLSCSGWGSTCRTSK